MNLLTTVHLDDQRTTMKNLQRYMVPNRIQDMKILCNFLGRFSDRPDMKDKTSPLIRLDLGGHSHIPLESLSDVLNICPDLEELRLAIPGQEILVRKGRPG